MLALTPYADDLHHLTRTDPDPRVRHRAGVLLLLTHGRTVPEAAHDTGCSAKRIRAWGHRYLAEGRTGLADRARPGRPPLLGPDARDVLETALTHSPLECGYPVTTWTVADLTDLLGRQGWILSTATVYRALHAMGYRYRRPRHDLRHRQDPEAVASAKHVLAELQKRGLLPGLDFGLSTWMSARSIPTPTWQKPGSTAVAR
jgi:transposase